MLCGDNYPDWKDKILLKLGCMDLDLALREETPNVPTENSEPSEKIAYAKWERSNRLSLMTIKSYVSRSIRGSIPDCDKAKDFMKAIKEQFVTCDKALATTLIQKLTSTKYDPLKGVRVHIMQLRDIASQLKSLKIEMSDAFLVHFHFVLSSCGVWSIQNIIQYT